jgi:PIN domain nuclease of toxin-antitoxin system
VAPLLDGCGLIALLVGESAADDVELLLRRGGARMVAANLAEVHDHMIRVRGTEPAALGAVLDDLAARTIDVVPITPRLAADAGRLRARHYRRGSCDISLADAFLLAAAAPGDEIATADAGVAAVAVAEGISVIALPNSAGEPPL